MRLWQPAINTSHVEVIKCAVDLSQELVAWRSIRLGDIMALRSRKLGARHTNAVHIASHGIDESSQRGEIQIKIYDRGRHLTASNLA